MDKEIFEDIVEGVLVEFIEHSQKAWLHIETETINMHMKVSVQDIALCHQYLSIEGKGITMDIAYSIYDEISLTPDSIDFKKNGVTIGIKFE